MSPSKYKPPKMVTQKTFREIAPPNISPLGGLYLEFVLEYRVRDRSLFITWRGGGVGGFWGGSLDF